MTIHKSIRFLNSIELCTQASSRICSKSKEWKICIAPQRQCVCVRVYAVEKILPECEVCFCLGVWMRARVFGVSI